jgi:Epoxide hydrolase N terminus
MCAPFVNVRKAMATVAIETIDRNRRWILMTAMTSMAGATAASLLTSHSAAAPRGDEIRPFRVNVADEVLVDLRRRLASTRWPDRETVVDDSQGVPLEMMQDLARYWATDYDWRKVETRLNALPQFIIESTGWTSISFTFVRSMKMRCRSSSRTAGQAPSSSS